MTVCIQSFNTHQYKAPKQQQSLSKLKIIANSINDVFKDSKNKAVSNILSKTKKKITKNMQEAKTIAKNCLFICTLYTRTYLLIFAHPGLILLPLLLLLCVMIMIGIQKQNIACRKLKFFFMFFFFLFSDELL